MSFESVAHQIINLVDDETGREMPPELIAQLKSSVAVLLESKLSTRQTVIPRDKYADFEASIIANISADKNPNRFNVSESQATAIKSAVAVGLQLKLGFQFDDDDC